MFLVAAPRSSSAGTNNLPPLTFHHVHGDNIRLCNGGTIARRHESFCKGVTFSARPVRVGEKVSPIARQRHLDHIHSRTAPIVGNRRFLVPLEKSPFAFHEYHKTDRRRSPYNSRATMSGHFLHVSRAPLCMSCVLESRAFSFEISTNELIVYVRL